MAIDLELGNNYGMKNVKEVLETIQEMKDCGMTDEEINAVLERSKESDVNDNDI